MTSSGPQKRTLCVGRLYCDLIFGGVPRLPSLGTEIFADGLAIRAGGGAYITAAHLSALGHASSLAALLPNAPFTDLIEDELSHSQINANFCKRQPHGSDPQITVALAVDSDRAFISRKSDSAFADFEARDLIEHEIDHVHIGEVSTLIEHPDLIEIAREASASLSLDCGWDDALDGSAAAPLIAQVDVFLPNEIEAQHLRACGVSEPFAPLTIVKRGPQGATAFKNGETISRAGLRADVVDTTGAGDAFNAGFLSAWLDGKSIGACLDQGNIQGAAAVQVLGGFAREHFGKWASATAAQ